MAGRRRQRGMELPEPPEVLMAELRTIGETHARELVQRAGAEGQQMLERYRAALR